MSSGGLFTISGNDWLGIGATGSEAYKGTAECGSRPNCLWTKECKRKVANFEECVKKVNQERSSSNAQFLALEARRLEADKQEQIKKYLLVAAAIILLLLIIKKRKPKT